MCCVCNLTDRELAVPSTLRCPWLFFLLLHTLLTATCDISVSPEPPVMLLLQLSAQMSKPRLPTAPHPNSPLQSPFGVSDPMESPFDKRPERRQEACVFASQSICFSGIAVMGWRWGEVYLCRFSHRVPLWHANVHHWPTAYHLDVDDDGFAGAETKMEEVSLTGCHNIQYYPTLLCHMRSYANKLRIHFLALQTLDDPQVIVSFLRHLRCKDVWMNFPVPLFHCVTRHGLTNGLYDPSSLRSIAVIAALWGCTSA